MKQYLNLLDHVLTDGINIETRNGMRRTIYGHQMRFFMSDGFPAITTKKIFWKGITAELCWFLNGMTNINYLHEYDVHIWDANADEQGECGPIYGYQWRNWNGSGIDQITRLLHNITKSPYATRHVVTAWNPEQMSNMALPPCHNFFQVHCLPTRSIKLQVSMRSTDVCLGLPFNIASYALLGYMIARLTGYYFEELIMDLSNVHIYQNHIQAAHEQTTRLPQQAPTLVIPEHIDPSLRNLDPLSFKLKNYHSHKAIHYDLIP